ncbi:MAG: chemotaxis protein CheC [Gemmatimonadales bacterium]|jgi:chemotaxis protein CheC
MERVDESASQILDLRHLELDALKEVANIGAGHAATALNQLTDRRVMIDVPRVGVCPIEQAAAAVGNEDRIVAAILMQVLGDLTGRSLMMFDKTCAMQLVDMLLGRESGITHVLGEIERSTLKETANILTGAYLNGLSTLLGLMLIPSVPKLAVDVCGAMLSSSHLDFGKQNGVVIVLDTRFRFDPGDTGMSGHFVLLPDTASLRVILKAVRVR